ncbi:MAG: hypothetical protein ABSA48_02000 [Terracidiphilus sp.]|jgi:hypothetical protein
MIEVGNHDEQIATAEIPRQTPAGRAGRMRRLDKSWLPTGAIILQIAFF